MSLEGRDTMDVPALVNVIKALFARRGLFCFSRGPGGNACEGRWASPLLTMRSLSLPFDRFAGSDPLWILRWCFCSGGDPEPDCGLRRCANTDEGLTRNLFGGPRLWTLISSLLIFDEAGTAKSPQLAAAGIGASDRRQASMPSPLSLIVALAVELEASEARARRAEHLLAAHGRHCICRAEEAEEAGSTWKADALSDPVGLMTAMSEELPL